jgi:hypothetical protein
MEIKLTFSRPLTLDENDHLIHVVETAKGQVGGGGSEYGLSAETLSALVKVGCAIAVDAAQGHLPSFTVEDYDDEDEPT